MLSPMVGAQERTHSVKTTRLAAFAVGAALVSSSILAATPASAQALSFTNTLATPSMSDDDITSVDVDYGDSILTTTFHVQNVDLTTDLGVQAIVGKGPSGIVGGGGAVFFGGEFNGATTDTEAAFYTGGGSTPIPGAVVNLSRNASANTITVSVSTANLNLPSEVYVAGFVNQSSSAYAGTFYSGSDIGGFGPVIKGTPITTTALELTWPTQQHNGTPVLAKATVSPATATGTVQFFDGTTLLGSLPLTGGAVYYALPSALSSGAHAIHATYVPTAPGGYLTSTSSAVALNVLSSAKATETTISLSKSTQKFKKTPAKLTVKVSGKPAGSVVVKDGKKVLKTIVLKGGTAKYTFSKSLKKGTHKITATYVPLDIEAYATSTSKAKTLKVKK